MKKAEEHFTLAVFLTFSQIINYVSTFNHSNFLLLLNYKAAIYEEELLVYICSTLTDCRLKELILKSVFHLFVVQNFVERTSLLSYQRLVFVYSEFPRRQKYKIYLWSGRSIVQPKVVFLLATLLRQGIYLIL